MDFAVFIFESVSQNGYALGFYWLGFEQILKLGLVWRRAGYRFFFARNVSFGCSAGSSAGSSAGRQLSARVWQE